MSCLNVLLLASPIRFCSCAPPFHPTEEKPLQTSLLHNDIGRCAPRPRPPSHLDTRTAHQTLPHISMGRPDIQHTNGSLSPHPPSLDLASGSLPHRDPAQRKEVSTVPTCWGRGMDAPPCSGWHLHSHLDRVVS